MSSTTGSRDGKLPLLIVSSTVDPASENIAENLVKHYGFSETQSRGVLADRDQNILLVKVDKPPIYVTPSDISLDASAIVFASKHVSSTDTPALTVHATGNLTKKAEFGGEPEEVSLVDPTGVRRALRRLREGVVRESVNIDVTMEATHHGPTSFPVPVCFVEIGSGLSEWGNPLLGRLTADAIMATAVAGDGVAKNAVGFGGTHYSDKFTRICLDGDFQIGHIVPRHAFESGITDSVVGETLSRTTGNPTTALVDWKGLTGSARKRLVASLESWSVEVERC
jgi:D-aminoacyl-tRNA deacylase